MTKKDSALSRTEKDVLSIINMYSRPLKISFLKREFRAGNIDEILGSLKSKGYITIEDNLIKRI